MASAWRRRRWGQLALTAAVLVLLDPGAHAARKKGAAAHPPAEQRVREATQRQAAAVELANAGRVAEAVVEFQACADLLDGLESRRIQRAQVVSMLGNAKTLMGDIAQGLEHWIRAVKLDPLLADARQNIIKALHDQGRYAEALKYARKGAKLQPDHVDFLVSVGDNCKAVRNFTCAKSSYHRALEVDPDHFVATFSLAVAHRDLMELNEALPIFERAGQISPANPAVVNALAVVRGDTCLWGKPDFSDPAYTEGKGNRFIRTAKSGLPERQSPIHPLLLAYYLDDPELLKAVVASHARLAEREAAVYVGQGSIDRETNQPDVNARVRKYFTFENVHKVLLPSHRLRVGYLTADIHDHPTALLIHGMFLPQKTGGKIEVYMYSYGPDDGSAYRNLIKRECEHFKHLERKPYLEIAQEINRDGVHILVDMKQHTESHALHVLALHPAPVQVAWLGFPGGVGNGLVQHVVGDAVVSPPEHAQWLEERLALMPMQVSYQVNNYKRDPHIGTHTNPFPPPSDPAWRTADVPAGNGVRYTMLNHARKMKPQRFSSCMTILERVPESTLSVLSRHNTTGDNLRRESEARGVRGSRLHMAAVLGKREHLRRMHVSQVYVWCVVVRCVCMCVCLRVSTRLCARVFERVWIGKQRVQVRMRV